MLRKIRFDSSIHLFVYLKNGEYLQYITKKIISSSKRF